MVDAGDYSLDDSMNDADSVVEQRFKVPGSWPESASNSPSVWPSASSNIQTSITQHTAEPSSVPVQAPHSSNANQANMSGGLFAATEQGISGMFIPTSHAVGLSHYVPMAQISSA